MRKVRVVGMSLLVICSLVLMFLIYTLMREAQVAPGQAAIVAMTLLVYNALYAIVSGGAIVIMVWVIVELINKFNGK